MTLDQEAPHAPVGGNLYRRRRRRAGHRGFASLTQWPGLAHASGVLHFGEQPEVARTANVGMIEQRLGTALARRNTIEVVVENRSDAFVGHCVDFERAGRDRLGACRRDARIEPQHAETGSKALLGMRPICQDGCDQCFDVRPDRARLAVKAVRRPSRRCGDARSACARDRCRAGAHHSGPHGRR